MVFKFAVPYAIVLFGCLSAYGGDMPSIPPVLPVEDQIAALRGVKVENATVVSVERDSSPTLTLKDNRVLNSIPPRTIVKLVLNPAIGSTINVEIWLPDAAAWNGRLVSLGNGGPAGTIISSDLALPAVSGYAVATTDMGTAPAPDSGIGNKEVWKDFGFRATHLMTIAAKLVMKAYYGRGPEFSYFKGRSTGGQQGLQEAQRYPLDYDGIVAAIPAHCRTPLHAYFLWNDQILTQCPFTKTQEENVIAAGNEYMASRENPASAGKFISDPRCSKADMEAVIDLARKKDPSLTKDHADALMKLFSGPRHAVTGERIFNGIPLGSSLSSSHGHLYLFKWVFGSKKKLSEINFGEDFDSYTAALGPYLNAEDPDLSAFEKRGGKMIMTVGTADSIVPYHASLDYYDRVVEVFGSLEKVKSFFRFYLIPGMAHGGGPGINTLPDMLEVVRAWREKGIVPEDLEGRRVVNGKTTLTIPIYPYPTRAIWDPAKGTYEPIAQARGRVERTAERFRPPAKE